MRERERERGRGRKKRVRDTVELKEEREKRERERNKRRNNDPAMAVPDQTDRFLRNISQSFPSKNLPPRTRLDHGSESDGTEGEGYGAHNGPSRVVNCNAGGVGRDRWPIEERIEDVELPAGSK